VASKIGEICNGLVCKTQSTWKNRRWRIVIIVGVVALVFLGIIAGAVAYTERSSFCANACHEMDVYGQTWRTSNHHEVECVDCHIEPGVINFAQAKISALREVYVHFSGNIEKPIAVTRNVPNSTCTRSGCHNKNNVPTRVKLKNGQWFPHVDHWQKDIYCRDCHYQVVHKSIPGKPNIDIHSMEHCMSLRHLPQARPRAARRLQQLPYGQVLAAADLPAPGGVRQVPPQVRL
jgi:nitrate/TMAO reductase-like tetraheme cytochrome c subunit